MMKSHPQFGSFPPIDMASIILISSSNTISYYPLFGVPNKFHIGPGKSFLARWSKHWQMFSAKANTSLFCQTGISAQLHCPV